MEITDIKEKTDRLIEEASNVVIAAEDVITKLLVALLAQGHVLLEDMPGSGKTTLAKTIAKLVGVDAKRVQFTPDLMPSDITGLNVYSQKDGAFHLIKGPVFTNIFLADEINRATPRAQASLLEAMEEKQVTIDGETMLLANPFFVIATENPIETTGTYPLPEAQVDRFMMKLSMGKLDAQAELQVMDTFIGEHPLPALEPVCSAEELRDMQRVAKTVRVDSCVREYIVKLIIATRENHKVVSGASTRAMLALTRASQCYAAMQGRNYVIPDDVKYLAKPVLAHRLCTYGSRSSVGDIALMQEILASVEVPVEEWKA